MIKNKSNAFRIRLLTNMHVGSGETNFGIIDNLIQRDAVSNFPCIHSSGLKGGIKQFLHTNGEKSEMLKYIFGSDTTSNGKGQSNSSKDNQAGAFTFLDAHLLAFPIRSDKQPYFLATCPSAINHFIKMSTALDADFEGKAVLGKLAKAAKDLTKTQALTFGGAENGIFLEDEKVNFMPFSNLSEEDKLSAKEQESVKKIFGDQDFIVVSDALFAEVCDDFHLPVIARNQLENGMSKNLFYEQVLPREALLFFFIIAPKDDAQFTNLNLSFNGNYVQLGGNATIGYGLTEIRLLNGKTK